MSSCKRVLCKYFANGACFKGEHCEFAHDWSAPANNICTFYQKGICSYGSRCRYEHVKPSRLELGTPSSSAFHHQDVAFDFDPQALSSSSASPQQHLRFLYEPDALSSATALSGVMASPMDSDGLSAVPGKTAWNLSIDHHGYLEDMEPLEPRSSNPADRSICSYAAVGNCPRGENCPHIHGDLCPICEKHCLHPFRPQEREEHMKMCEKKQKQLGALKLSQEIECSVCLETVLSKPTPAERKFGILSECDHPFCITCIRNWRSSLPTPGVDINGALRACPICRKLSYFVIPSVIWYSTKEEKQELIDNYKAKLKSIDCRHFNFGNGNCPFGTSCFYKHAYRDGRLEEVVLRHLNDGDGQTVIAKNIRLSDFLERMHIS